MVDLTGKVALVTGSSRGIGQGCALEMARVGANVTVNYRSHDEEAEAVAEEIREMGRQALVVQADVSDRTAVAKLVEATVERFGRLDILVSNAYYSVREPFLDMSVEGARGTLDVTFWGGFHAAQIAARQMVAQGGGGSILFITSVHAFIPFGNHLAYNTSKAGTNHMAATIAGELAGHHIRVNVIEPGWIDTPGERKYTTEAQLQEEGKKLPWGRLGRPDEIGKAAAFLCSDAASYITGAVLRVDGGFWLPVRRQT